MATRLKYNIGATINLGDYQSARVDIGMEKDISEGNVGDDSYHDRLKDIQAWCDAELAAKVKQIKEDNNVK